MKKVLLVLVSIALFPHIGNAAEIRGQVHTEPHLKNLIVTKMTFDAAKKRNLVTLEHFCGCHGVDFGPVTRDGNASSPGCNGDDSCGGGCCAHDKHMVELDPSDVMDAQFTQVFLSAMGEFQPLNLVTSESGQLTQVELSVFSGNCFIAYATVVENGVAKTKPYVECAQGPIAKK